MSWFRVSQLIQAKKYEELMKYLGELPNPDKILQTACRELAFDELTFNAPWEKIMERATEIYDQTKARGTKVTQSGGDAQGPHTGGFR